MAEFGKKEHRGEFLDGNDDHDHEHGSGDDHGGSDSCEHDHGELDQDKMDHAGEALKKYPGDEEFIHLHAHTLFSKLDGVASPDDYINRCKELGMNSIAITDHGSLAGLPDAYFAAKKHNVKMIAGIEAYLNEYHQDLEKLRSEGLKLGDLPHDDTFLEKDQIANRIRSNRHIVLLAKNQTGYQNLLELNSLSWSKGFYYKPRMWMDAIRKYKEGLVLLSGCLNGPINHELMRAVEAKRLGESSMAKAYLHRAVEWIKVLREEFAEDFFFEIQMPGPDLADGYDVLHLGLKLAKSMNLQTVLTGDSHYLDPQDWEVQRAMMAIDQDTTIDDPNMFVIDTCEGYLKSRAEFRQTFWEQDYEKVATVNDIEKACDNSLLIAQKCEMFAPDLSPKLPEIENSDNKLARLTMEGLIKKGLQHTKKKYFIDGMWVTYLDQIKIELQRIKEKKFSSYFLITKDLVKYARDMGHDVGPARGSAGGSLVCYLIGITELDPLKWELSFERFLSMSRGGHMLKCTME